MKQDERGYASPGCQSFSQPLFVSQYIHDFCGSSLISTALQSFGAAGPIAQPAVFGKARNCLLVRDGLL